MVVGFGSRGRHCTHAEHDTRDAQIAKPTSSELTWGLEASRAFLDDRPRTRTPRGFPRVPIVPLTSCSTAFAWTASWGEFKGMVWLEGLVLRRVNGFGFRRID